MDLTSAGPDADSIDLTEITERTTEGLDGTGFRILIERSALNEIHTHGRSITDKEICGVLVGNVWRDAGGPYLHVKAVVRGEYAAHQAAQVTFTADTWTYINHELDSRYPDDRIVGWYHTHPGFGVFLSEMDLFIQQSFFDLPWQIALVFDPVRDEEAIFSWRKGNCQPVTFTVGTEIVVEPADVSVAPPPAVGRPSASPKKRDGMKVLRILRKYAWRSFSRTHLD